MPVGDVRVRRAKDGRVDPSSHPLTVANVGLLIGNDGLRL
jgi:hypothetical protein